MKSAKKIIIALLIALALLTLVACSNRDAQSSAAPSSSSTALSSQAEPPISSAPVSSSSSSETAPLADDEMSFLEKAYSLGYTDKQLELLEAYGIPEDRIVNLSDVLLDENSTPDGRYVLGWYEADFVRRCWVLFDTETNKTTVLPEWENGYSQFEFIDDESFYAFVDGANYESGVKFYKAENPSAPYASWNPADSGAANEKNKNLLYIYKIDSEKMILAFWCETPKELDGRVETGTDTYKITLINYDGDIVKEMDTGILLGQSKTGIAGPEFARANAGRTPTPGIVYFDIGEISYECNYQSGTVSKI
jgi:hypothetical protein